MFKSLFVSTALLFSLSAFADGGHTHTPDYCSTKNPAVCAHLGIHKDLKAGEASEFIVDIMTPNGEAYTNLSVVLWMPAMGHGSAPVTLQDMGHNHYLVSNAQFIMAGQWVVKLGFDFAGEALAIEVPVEIGE